MAGGVFVVYGRIKSMRPSKAWISQRYGVFPQASGQPWIHVGDDYAGERGEEVVTISPGTVLFAGPGQNVPNNLADLLMLYRGSDASGNCAIIQHAGWVETFNHLEFYTVNTGDNVERGWRVGGMGDSGNAYGVHLHHETLTTPASPEPPFSRYDPQNQIEWEDKEAARIALLSAPQATELAEEIMNIRDIVTGLMNYRLADPGYLKNVRRVRDFITNPGRNVWHEHTVKRNGKEIPAIQELADIKTIALRLEETLKRIEGKL